VQEAQDEDKGGSLARAGGQEGSGAGPAQQRGQSHSTSEKVPKVRFFQYSCEDAWTMAHAKESISDERECAASLLYYCSGENDVYGSSYECCDFQQHSFGMPVQILTKW
jgi:hypothetical protein